ncbi:MAG: hypothetical protein KKG47_17215 [Proteobacteria bacterium]|nr:hypothetical protein [Pseudomonadota bacterium]
MQGESTDGDRLMCGDHRNDWDVSREELIDALREAHQQVLELQAQRKEYHWLEEALHKRTRELSERVKELDCLYFIADCIRDRDFDLVELLRRIVAFLPRGFQNPERTWVTLSILCQTFQSSGFRQTAYFRDVKILTSTKQTGRLRICVSPPSHAPEIPLFLREEIALVNTVSQWIGSIVEHKMLEERF